jgi:hypothetical protein
VIVAANVLLGEPVDANFLVGIAQWDLGFLVIGIPRDIRS